MKVKGNVTQDEREGYVRKDEYLKKGDPEWEDEARLETRKKPPPPAVEGDVFDRQRVIVEWDQTNVEKKTCLILGAGGVGQNVALLLGRIGVKEIITIDNDEYEATNMNRQCLGGIQDIGKPKVNVVKDALENFAVRTTVTPLHIDVVKEWQQVVSSAKRADVIFNGIDIGPSFDTAVASLSKSIAIPLVQGQSYGWSFTTEYYNSQPGTIGAWDAIVEKSLFDKKNPSDSIEETLEKWEVDKTAPTTKHCLLNTTSFPASYKQAALTLLSPANITSCIDLGFLPVPSKIPTRFIGSWSVPCMGSAVSMVGQWMESITGQGNRIPDTMVQHNLSAGCSEIEANGYQLSSQIEILGEGVSPKDVAEMMLPVKQKSSDPSTHRYTTELLNDEADSYESIYFGTVKTSFKEVAGSFLETTDIQCEHGTHFNGLNSLPENVVVPVIPCFLFKAVKDPSTEHNVPTPLQIPLLKIKDGPIPGITSGKRSALIKTNGKWHRLKGCGNGDEGAFPLEIHGIKGQNTPRGCGFEDSVLCEMHMCRRIKEAGVPVGNTPVTAWHYGKNAVPCKGSENIPKWCGVFETVGDRRAGDHLISGILRLATLMVPESQMKALRKEVQRKRENSDADDLLETDMLTACEMQIADLSDAVLYEAPPPVKPDCPLWNQIVERLHVSLSKAKAEADIGSILLHVAKRVGWECSDVMCALEKAGISWGTYRDCLGTHCNAHINNMVVVRNGGERLLAAVDFDMAFTREAYDTSKGMGILEEVMQFEQLNGMRQVLSGSSFSSTGVHSDACHLSSAYLPFKAALYDTMVFTYDARPTPSPYIASLQPVVADIVTLALILTKDFVA
eukprot:TRINITY_DN18651_c0_g1_i1.p1 TRINITY_DN18651_c0_g1~~TRINITY_DN18651_c0_g1_i1.p1  ORF type:complete len:864 (+),score=141.21 TRINITY_DN18651_c0_g1_i1:58-2592(+)